MFEFLRQHGLGVVVSLGLHAVLVLALMVGITFAPRARPPVFAPVIEAVAVDSEAVERELRRLEELEQQEIRRQQEAERQAREAAERARREQEQARLQAEQERRRAEEERRRLEQLAREREEAERLAREREEAARREAERRAELERQRAEEERRQREEEERRRREEEARLAEQRRQEEERRRREEEERRLLEEQLQQELAAEAERLRAVQSGELDAYIRMIQARIEQNWIEPPGTPPDLDCQVNIVQIPSGDIVDVRIGSCNGNEAVIRSIEAAVQRSSPLPLPRTPSLFERNLNLRFCPNC